MISLIFVVKSPWFLVDLCVWIERDMRQSRDVVDNKLTFFGVDSDGFDVDVGSPPTDKIICGRLVQSSKIDEMKFIYLQSGSKRVWF
jgi:hypothetical protein